MSTKIEKTWEFNLALTNAMRRLVDLSQYEYKEILCGCVREAVMEINFLNDYINKKEETNV